MTEQKPKDRLQEFTDAAVSFLVHSVAYILVMFGALFFVFMWSDEWQSNWCKITLPPPPQPTRMSEVPYNPDNATTAWTVKPAAPHIPEIPRP